MPKPRPASFSTARGPSEVNSWLPTLNVPTTPRSFRANAMAGLRWSISRATISFRDELLLGVLAPLGVPAGLWRVRADRILTYGPLGRKHLIRVLQRKVRGRWSGPLGCGGCQCLQTG